MYRPIQFIRKYSTNNRIKYPSLYSQINYYANKNQKSISLNELIFFGSSNENEKLVINAAKFMYNELPIRLSRRIKDLDLLPFGLSTTDNVNKIREWYIHSFSDFISIPEPNSYSDAEKLHEISKIVYQRHSSTLITMARGIKKIEKDKNINLSYQDLQKFLDRFYMSRIGIRVLLDQYISLFGENKTNDYSGIICLKTEPVSILQDAITDVEDIVYRNRYCMPEIKIESQDVFFPYIPSHLYYCLFEILKNAVVAVNVKHNYANSIETAHKFDKYLINCKIINDDNLILIKISDSGTGIEQNVLKKIWNYAYTTTLIDDNDLYTSDFSTESPLAGFGYGLPITKLLLEYSGGRIDIFSKKDIGTDVYIVLNKNGDFNEILP